MIRRLPLAVVLLVLAGSPAHAKLIDLGNGMIYDTVQDLTWLEDTRYSRTSGYDSDGIMTFTESVAWADSLVFGGFGDWRLPQYFPPGMRPPSDSWNVASEITILMAQLGWGWICDGQPCTISQHIVGQHAFSFDYTAGPTVGPFLNFSSTTQVPMFWLTNAPNLVWNAIFDFDPRDGGGDNPAGAWAVRDGGNPMARVPEPSALLFVGLGALGATLTRTRKRGRSTRVHHRILRRSRPSDAIHG